MAVWVVSHTGIAVNPAAKDCIMGIDSLASLQSCLNYQSYVDVSSTTVISLQ